MSNEEKQEALEKAKELIASFAKIVPRGKEYECAMLCTEEIISSRYSFGFEDYFWYKVQEYIQEFWNNE